MDYLILFVVGIVAFTILEIVKQVLEYLREGRSMKAKREQSPDK